MVLDFDNLVRKYNLNISGIIHIGAHYGEEYSLYKKHNINNIIMFEPLIHNFNVLKDRLKDQNVKLVNKALGNENKKIEMYVEYNNSSQSSSILKPKLHEKQYPNIIFNDKKIVDMIRLDDYDFENFNYNFINIDVQGYELEVFKGSTNLLKNIDYIISEVNRADLYDGCVIVNDLDAFLNQYGFIRVETNWIGQTWGDGFYIKKRN